MKKYVSILLILMMMFSANVKGIEFDKKVVSKDKVFTIKFSKNIDKLNKGAIKVLKDGKEVEVDIKKVAENKVTVAPVTGEYKAGEYTLKLNKNISSIDLKQDVEMNFIVEEDTKNNDNINYTENIENLAEFFSIDRAEIKEDGNIYYTYGDIVSDYLPKSNLTPDMNEKIAELVKYLIYDNNEKKNFVRATYLPEMKDMWGSEVSIALLEKWNYPNEKFKIIFVENQLDELNNYSKIWLEMRGLTDDEYMEKEDEVGGLNAFYYEPTLVEKFKNSIKILFENKDWESIYNFIMEQYKLYTTTEEAFSNSKEIDGIKVISKYDRFGRFYIYFQY